MSEIIRTKDIAKIIGCSVNQARYNIKHGYWKFGRVIKSGPKTHRYEANITEVARYVGIDREEAIRRLKGGDT